MVILYILFAFLGALIMFFLTQSFMMAALGGFMGGFIGALCVTVYDGIREK